MKVLALVLGLAAASYATYLALAQTPRLSGGAPGQPVPQQMDNVREAARRIEADALKRAAEAAKAPEGG